MIFYTILIIVDVIFAAMIYLTMAMTAGMNAGENALVVLVFAIIANIILLGGRFIYKRKNKI